MRWPAQPSRGGPVTRRYRRAAGAFSAAPTHGDGGHQADVDEAAATRPLAIAMPVPKSADARRFELGNARHGLAVDFDDKLSDRVAELALNEVASAIGRHLAAAESRVLLIGTRANVESAFAAAGISDVVR